MKCIASNYSSLSLVYYFTAYKNAVQFVFFFLWFQCCVVIRPFLIWLGQRQPTVVCHSVRLLCQGLVHCTSAMFVNKLTIVHTWVFSCACWCLSLSGTKSSCSRLSACLYNKLLVNVRNFFTKKCLESSNNVMCPYHSAELECHLIN